MAKIRINTNEYNVGALAGKYALKDMSNTGKFTNTVSILPVRTNIEISDPISGIITLKQGSSVTVPNGLSSIDGKTLVEEYVRIKEDIQINVGHRLDNYNLALASTSKTYLVFNYESGVSGELELGDENTYRYFEEDEGEFNKNTFMHVAFKQKCALPLGYFDANWVFHKFDAIGFYGDLMWVGAGTEYLIPRGRLEDYGLDVKKVMLGNVAYTRLADAIEGTTIQGESGEGILFIDNNGKATLTETYSSSVEYTTHTGIQYVSSENFLYDQNHIEVEGCKIADVTVRDNKFDSIKNFNTYQSVDYAETVGRLSLIDESALHKDGRNETVLGEIYFPALTTFDNITVNGGVINNCNVAGTLNVQATGNISFIDADIKAVNRTAHPDCINIVGKTNATRGGLVFGNAQAVKLLADEELGTLNIMLNPTTTDEGNPRTPKILPATDNKYEIGAAGARFKNIYSTTFTGTSTQSRWADFAEVYETDKEYPVGTLLQWGGEKDFTIAKDEVNAVVSERPGVLLNSDAEGQPVALAGRVRVRVKGKIKKHDKIFLSHTDGVGTNIGLLGERPIGRALEAKDNEEEGLILCAVQFNV